MKVLFDSHALVWFLLGDRRFPKQLRADLEHPDTEFVISAVCVWEIGIKVRRGRWMEAKKVIPGLGDMLETSRYIPLAITIEHARTAAFFAWEHRDPFDRLLAAQSQIEGTPLLSADPVFHRFGAAVLW
jgi:PIN domain nuclease of toxin-antitoxin system